MRYLFRLALAWFFALSAAGAGPAFAAKPKQPAWPPKIQQADFRNLKQLAALHDGFEKRFKKRPKAVAVGELMAASSVAYSLWQVAGDEQRRARYASNAFVWASEAHERAPKNTDAAFLRARAQLANAETQGFLRSLPSLGNIEQLALGVYFEEAAFFYGSAPALLGRLYQEAPSISVGDGVRAVEMYEQALLEEPRQTAALIGLAKAALREGDVPKAKAVLERVLVAKPFKPAGRYEKEMDFTWHVDRLRALYAKQRLAAGDAPKDVAAAIDKLPRAFVGDNLAKALKKQSAAAKPRR